MKATSKFRATNITQRTSNKQMRNNKIWQSNCILCKPLISNGTENTKKKHATKMVPQCLRCASKMFVVQAVLSLLISFSLVHSLWRCADASYCLHINLLFTACVVWTFFIGTLKSMLVNNFVPSSFSYIEPYFRQTRSCGYIQFTSSVHAMWLVISL